MNLSGRSNTAIEVALFLMVLLLPVLALAGDVVGTVTHLSGPLFVRKPDGVKKSLSQKSAVEQGDVVITEKNTYARIKFTDNSEVTLRPNTQLVIERYSFDKQKPEQDSAVFGLVKGGLRAVTGSVGKRGDQDSYKMKTKSATIGIRGTHYGCSECQGDCGGAMPDGLYVDVADGAIIVSNEGGARIYNAGQNGYVRDRLTTPALLPKDPGLKFTPPASLSSPSAGQGKDGPGNAVDCQVR